MFEVCDIVKAKNKEIIRFIREKIGVAIELAANKSYLEIILNKALTQILKLIYLFLILI